MRKASLLTDLFAGTLVSDARLPRNQQLYRAIRQSILLGQIVAGQQLPPSRSLAAKLGIARNTVLYAYERLLAEGYVHANTGSGTYVADTLPDNAPMAHRPAAPARLSETTGPALSRRGSGLIARPGARFKPAPSYQVSRTSGIVRPRPGSDCRTNTGGLVGSTFSPTQAPPATRP